MTGARSAALYRARRALIIGLGVDFLASSLLAALVLVVLIAYGQAATRWMGREAPHDPWGTAFHAWLVVFGLMSIGAFYAAYRAYRGPSRRVQLVASGEVVRFRRGGDES